MLAALLLTLRFSPDWIALGRGVGELRAAPALSRTPQRAGSLT
jgi:hypothetical protein